MAKDITLLGQNYVNVPGVNLPQTGGGTAYFSDTSDATATADKILQGYTAYGADGSKITGTATEGGSSNPVIIIDEQDSHGGIVRTIIAEQIEEITISTNGTVTQQLQAGKIYHFTSNALTNLTISFASTNDIQQYHFDFISSSTAVNLTLPANVVMPDDFDVEVNTKYEIDILNNYGVVAEWVYQEASS